MILQVKVIPRAKSNRIQKLADNSLKVYVSAAAENNRANKAVIELLSEYLGCRKNEIVIVRGGHSQKKAIQVFNPPLAYTAGREVLGL